MALGQHIEAGGGEYEYDEIETLLRPVTDVPHACRDQQFWLVGPPPWLW
ncbi:MAG TPA: hypothetical protein VFW86_03625 [Candidatus Limnocylindrales bacterium]|nr:hypothetical protein [Candidatus Limnocylindrales bacterium]